MSRWKVHRQIATFLLVVLVISLSFFIAMWTVGWANDNFIQQAVTVTFSKMLETVVPEMKILYGVFYVWYAIVRCAIVVLLTSYDLGDRFAIVSRQHYCPNFLFICTTFYVLSTGLMLIGLLGVPFYDMDSPYYGDLHSVFACIAFINGVLSCVFLFARRCILVFYFAVDEDAAYYRRSKIALFFNFIWILAGVATIIGFGVTRGGLWEFFLSLIIVSDVGWQIGDFASDPRSMEKHRALVGSVPSHT